MHRYTVPFVFLLLLLGACGSPGPEVETPTLPELTAGEWNEFDGGGDTVCADGSEYKYYAYPGSSNKVVIDFQGGGACWDSITCSSPYSNPNPDLGGFYLNQLSVSLDDDDGIYDKDNSDNPTQDWYHVFIPYCTGDLHVGDNTKMYTNGGTSYDIEHKGALNAGAVLDWTFENFSAPESIFITGCSAGAYGAAFWTAEIAGQYPDADIYQLGDCGAGVATDDWAATLGESWDVTATLPDATFDATFTTQTYIDTLDAHDIKMAQYNTLFDNVQIEFYAFATGQTDNENVGIEWSSTMLASLDTIEAASDDFVAYTSLADTDGDLANGTQHCIIVQENFYTTEVEGRSFRDWLDDYINGRTVGSVRASITP